MNIHVASRTLSGSAHPARLRIYLRLAEPACDGAYAGVIAKWVKLAAATLSFHLKEMSLAGLVTSESEGNRVRYRANRMPVQQLLKLLADSGANQKLANRAPAREASVRRSKN